ncbi:discoidin domain-containing protein, partial [Streptococcus sp. E24BD]|uniref:discoidin domain-containing protein n=1 Tax=Streptococcus sp. E24BD TaxID=3278715 RepID=UPI00359E6ADB
MKHLFDKQNKYSIRKFSIGVCSAVIGLSFLSAGTAYAEETGVQPVQPPVPAGPTGAASLESTQDGAVAEKEVEEVVAPESTKFEVSGEAKTESAVRTIDEVVSVDKNYAQADNVKEGFPATNAVDGSEATAWVGIGETEKPKLTVRLDDVARVERITYQAMQDGKSSLGSSYHNEAGVAANGYIEYSKTGEEGSWKKVTFTAVEQQDGQPHMLNKPENEGAAYQRRGNRMPIDFVIEPVDAKYFRLTATNTLVGNAAPANTQPHLVSASKFIPQGKKLVIEETVTETLVTDEKHYIDDVTKYKDQEELVSEAVAGKRVTVTTYEAQNGEKTSTKLGESAVTIINPKMAVYRRGTLERPIQTPPQAPAAVRLFNAPLQQDGETVSQVAVTLPQEAVASHVVKLKTNDAQVLKELTLEESHLEDGIAVLALDRLLENGQTYAVTIATVQGLESDPKTFVADTVAPPAAVSADFVAGTRQVDVVLPEGVQAGELAIVINPEGTTQETYFIGYASIPTGERRVQVTVNQDLLAEKTYNVQLMDATNNLSPMIEAAVRQQTPPSAPTSTLTPVYPPVETVEGEYNRPASSVGRITNVTFENGTASITYETGHKAQVNFYNDHVFRFNIEKEGAEFVSNPELVHAGRPANITLKNQANYQETYGQIGKLVDEESRYILETPKVLVIFDKKTSLMSVYDREKNAYVTKEVAPVSIAGGKTTQTLAQTEDEQFFGGGMQNGRFTHKGEKINIVNENNWIDGSVASPAPFYWSSKGYGVMRHTFRPGQYDFGTDNKAQLTSTHNEERFDAFYFINSKPADILKDCHELTGAPAVLPEYALYLGHLNAYNRDYWREVPKGTAGAVLFEDGKYYKEFDGRSHTVQPGDIKENLNGDTPESHQFSARAVIERYKRLNLPLGWFLPNDGYGAGYGQTETLDGNIQNLKAFVEWAKQNNVEVGLWTQADLYSTRGDVVTHRDIDKEVGTAGIRAIKTDVAWVGPGYNFGLNGVDEGAKLLTEKSGEDKARPFIVSLDGWTGTQRSAGIWSGDQRGGEWEYIRFHIPTYIGLGLSGNPNMGSDMDGIFGGGNAVINARDYQWKAFTSILMNMDGWGNEPKTPFSFDDRTTDINRMSMKLKSTLVPYAYSTGHDASVSGKPIVRAMLIDFSDQPLAYTKAVQYQYMYGDNFLVAPIYKNAAMKENGDDVRNNIFLPAGAEWIDLYTGQKYEGGQVLNNYEAPLWKLPVFVKNGAIIPMTNANNNPAEIDRGNRLIQFYPHKVSEFKLYEDDGKSVDYKAGKVATTLIKSVADDSNTTGRAVLTIERTEGDFDGFKKDKTTELHVNVSKDVESVQVKVNGQSVEVRRVNTLEEYSKGTNVFFYHKDTKLATYNPTSAEIKALDVTMNDLLKIKLAAHDVTTNKVEVTINGFSNAKATEQAPEGLEAPATPTNLATPEDTVSAKAIKATWSASDNATSYDVEHNGVLYRNIKATEFNFDGLNPGTSHTFKVRAVNAKGTSDWSDAVTAETKNDPWAEAIEINPASVTTNIRTQGGQGIDKLFDKKKGAQFHSRWNEQVSAGSYIRVDLGGVYDLDYLEYHQRNDGGVNGRVIWAKVWTSEDGETWDFTGSADWRSDANSVGKHTLDKRARYVHFQVDSSQNGFISGEEMLIFKKPGTRMFVPGDISNDGQITNDDKTSFLNYAGLRRADSDFGGYVERADANKNGLIDAYDISIAAVQLDGGVTERSTVAPSGNLRFEAEKLDVKTGEEVKVYLIADDLAAVNALTSTFQVSEADFELVARGNVTPESFTKQAENFSQSRTRSGQHDVVFSFINFGQKELLSGSGRVAYVTLKAKRDAVLNFTSQDNILVGNDLRRAAVDNQPVTALINYTEAPAVPTNVTVSRPTHGSVSLTWDAVPQAVRYIVEQEADGQFVEVGRTNEPHFNVYNLAPVSTYTFCVRATNPIGQSEATEAVSATTVAKDLAKKLVVAEKTASTPEQPNEPLSNFFDGDENTIYHSQWQKTDAVPSSLTLDLGEEKALSHLIYVPRPAASNGTITGLTVETSNDGQTWAPTGETIRWNRNALDKIAFLPEGTEARYIRINWLTSVGGFVSGQELYVIEATPDSEPTPNQNDTTQPPRQITDVNPQTDSGIIAEVQSADAKVAGLRVVFHKE